jgi:hypothetical protein
LVNKQLFVHTLETENDSILSLESLDVQRRIAAVLNQYTPDVVAFDPLSAFAIGDLNTDADMLATCRVISRLARQGNPARALIVVHHSLTGKAGAIKATGFDRSSFGRNSKVLQAWTRGQVNIAPVTETSNDVLAIGCGKCANGREFPAFAVRLNPASMVYEVAPDIDLAAWQAELTGKREPLMTADRVRELCKAPMSKAELAKAIMDDCGCVRQSAYRYVAQAVKAKKIKFNESSGNYTPR